MVEGLEHMTYSEKMEICLFSLKRRLRGIQLVCSFTQRGVVEKIVRLFPERHEERSRDNTPGFKENSKRMEGKYSPPQESEHWHRLLREDGESLPLEIFKTCLEKLLSSLI